MTDKGAAQGKVPGTSLSGGYRAEHRLPGPVHLGKLEREKLDEALERSHYRSDALIEVLHDVQEVMGFLSVEVLAYVADRLGLPPSYVYGVATFYHLFRFEAKGRHTCTVCTGTACYIAGAWELLASLEQEFGLRPGHITPDGLLDLETLRCPGSCVQAPLVIIDGDWLGPLTPEGAVTVLRDRLEATSKEEES